jgi:CBS domain containing-hemolysin-like protein
MAFLLLWALLAIVLSHICSLMEVTLLSIRTSTLLARQTAGSTGAAHLLEIKSSRVDDAIGAILILNTLAITIGATLGGAQAAQQFGRTGVGIFSAVLTVLLLFLSEIIPKTLATRYAGRLAAFTGHVLTYLIGSMAPVLLVNRAIIRLFARRPRERLTRHEFALLVGTAPQEGAISLAEARLIGSLIYSREILLKDVMTPHSMIFMMNAGQTVADLIAAPAADAFSRIPLFEGDRRHITGYVSHRDVLKSYALSHDGARLLASFRRPIPVFRDDEQVAKAFERLLLQHEAIAVVANKRGEGAGLATLEDMLEAILGMEITDEADAIAHLRPAIAQSRKHRAEQLRRMRMHQQRPPSNEVDSE